MIEGAPTWLFVAGSITVVVVTALIAWLSAPRAIEATYPTFDLLTVGPFRTMFASRAVRIAAQALFVALFLFVIVAGLFGVQQGGANIATVLTWTYWWILLVVLTTFVGKAWCFACPWDAVAGWLEKLKLAGRSRRALSLNLTWPKVLQNLYPATALFLVLTWLELGYGVTTRPEFTAILALIMFFLTFFPALIFEKRAFCRYGCLVGRISGLYALFAPLELRARDFGVCRTCKTHDCFTGNEKGDPCPTSQFLGGMTKNTYCILCAECIHTCPKDNVALNVRPFAQDLFKSKHLRFDEAAMVIVMLAMSTFHGLTMTPWWNAVVRRVESTLGWDFLAAFTAGMFGFLFALGALYLVFIWVAFKWAGPGNAGYRQLAIRFAYPFLPIALFYHLAHNSMHFFMEAGAIVPVLSDPMGLGWNLLGTVGSRPGPLLSSGVVWTGMVIAIVAGHLWSLLIAQRAVAHAYDDPVQARRARLPLLIAMISYSVLSLWIIAQPMEMRTGL